MRVVQGDVYAERLIAVILPDKVNGSQNDGPIAIAVDVFAPFVELAFEKAEEIIAILGTPPFLCAAMRSFAWCQAPALIVFLCRSKADIAVWGNIVLAGGEIVFAAPPDKIAVVLENLEKVGFAAFGMQHMVHGAMPAHMRVPTGHEATATGRADRILAEGR